MKKILAVVTALLTMLSVAGCNKDVLPSREEIDQFDIVQILGIDKSRDNPADIEFTVITQKAKESKSDAGSVGGKIYDIITGTGPTVFEAQRLMKSHSDKKLFFAYVDYILIGEEAAKEDLGKYMDYVSRNENIRLSPKVYIVKGCPVKEFISNTTTEGKYLGERLDNIEADISALSNFGEVRIIDVINMLDDLDSADVIPVLTCEEINNEKLIGADLPEEDVYSDGYAVVKDFKLTGFIDEEYSRGYNFLVNKVKSTPITVQDFSGHNVALEVIYEDTKVIAHFNGDDLEGVTYETAVIGHIAEQQSRENIWTQSGIEDLNVKMANVIKGEMEQVVAKAKEYQIDCIDLGEKIRMKHPYKWEKIKDRWREIFPQLNIQIEVEAKLKRSYNIREPNGYQMGS